NPSPVQSQAMSFSSHGADDDRTSGNVMGAYRSWRSTVPRSLALVHMELRPPECPATERQGAVCVLGPRHSCECCHFDSFLSANCCPESTSRQGWLVRSLQASLPSGVFCTQSLT